MIKKSRLDPFRVTLRDFGRSLFKSHLAMKFKGWSWASKRLTAWSTSQGCSEEKRRQKENSIFSFKFGGWTRQLRIFWNKMLITKNRGAKSASSSFTMAESTTRHQPRTDMHSCTHTWYLWSLVACRWQSLHPKWRQNPAAALPRLHHHTNTEEKEGSQMMEKQGIYGSAITENSYRAITH